MGRLSIKILRKNKKYRCVYCCGSRRKKDGERVIPTRQIRKEETDPYRRLTLQELANEIDKIKRGTLKSIYWCSTWSRKKTYTMLREANELKKKRVLI
ncbi:hypothetical protein GCM10020331_004600 [Ectobacillus funiculus]